MPGYIITLNIMAKDKSDTSLHGLALEMLNRPTKSPQTALDLLGLTDGSQEYEVKGFSVKYDESMTITLESF